MPFKFERGIQVTMIPSYHCPGAVMFLIESTDKAVLYTGDIRLESWWVQSLEKNPFLKPYLTGLRILDNVYLDTTFGYRGEPFIEMMSNGEGISYLVQVLKHYPLHDTDLMFCLDETVTGFEELWYNLVSIFNANIYVDSKMKRKLRILLKNGTLYCSFLCSKLTESPTMFNVCQNQALDCKFPVSIRSAIDCSLTEMKAMHHPVALANIDSAKLEEIDTTSSGTGVFKYNGRKWLLHNDFLLPQEVRVPFSRHSSYTECIDFISKLNPKQVYGCTDSKLTWDQGFQMSRIFGDFCRDDSFAFDKERSLAYGPMNKTSPVATINKWSEEYELKQLLSLQSFEFKGQHHVSAFSKVLNKDDLSYIEQSRTLSRFNKHYIGRNIEKYNKLIEQNKLKIQSKRSQNFEQRFLRNIDSYESSADSSNEHGESLSKKRKLCMNGNDFRGRLILSDCEKENLKLQQVLEVSLTETEVSIDDDFDAIKLSDYTTWNISNDTFFEDCASDEHGLGWFNIHLSCINT